MRIVSGKYKGRRYSGAIPAGIRPTTDSVREAIFNILSNYFTFEEMVVADVCAGTGFMGFEALSRGASFCYYFEKSRKAIELIKKIAVQFDIGNYNIVQGDAVKNLENISNDLGEKQFDLMFFDPPYGSDLFNPVIDVIHSYKLLSKNGLLVIEMPKKLNLILENKFNVLLEREFGITKLIVASNISNNSNS